MNVDAWLEGEFELAIREQKLAIREQKSVNKSSTRMRSEARKYILCSPNVRKLQRDTFDQHGMIPVRGQLIDPLTLKVRPIRKEDYATWTLAVAGDAWR